MTLSTAATVTSPVEPLQGPARHGRQADAADGPLPIEAMARAMVKVVGVALDVVVGDGIEAVSKLGMDFPPSHPDSLVCSQKVAPQAACSQRVRH